MVLMKKANGEYAVPDEKVTEFLKMGYSVIDSDGRILVEGEPSTAADFKEAYHKLKAKYDALKAERDALAEKLTHENAKLQDADGATQQDANKPSGNAQENAERGNAIESSTENKNARTGRKTAETGKAK